MPASHAKVARRYGYAFTMNINFIEYQYSVVNMLIPDDIVSY